MSLSKTKSRCLVDVSGIGDSGVRDELMNTLKTIVLTGRFGEGKSCHVPAFGGGYWDLLKSDASERENVRYIVIVDVDFCVEHFEEVGPHRWTAAIRTLCPSILAFAPRRTSPRLEAIDALVSASEGRLFFCKFKRGDRSSQERVLTKALAATRPDSLLEVRSAGERLWLEFGDGLRDELEWRRIPLPDAHKIRRETVQVSDDLASLEVLGEDGHVIDIDGTALRSLIDPKTATAVRDLLGNASRDLGERLRRRRASAHVTQEELSARTGLNQPSISRLESGAHQPRFDTLAKYAAGLGLTVPELLE